MKGMYKLSLKFVAYETWVKEKELQLKGSKNPKTRLLI